MNNKEILDKIEKEFFARLEEKTSWGKEQLKVLYLTTKSDVLSEYVLKDKKEN